MRKYLFDWSFFYTSLQGYDIHFPSMLKMLVSKRNLKCFKMEEDTIFQISKTFTTTKNLMNQCLSFFDAKEKEEMQYAPKCIKSLFIFHITSIIEIAFETLNFPILYVLRMGEIVYMNCTPDRLHRTITSGWIRRFQKIYMKINMSSKSRAYRTSIISYQ